MQRLQSKQEESTEEEEMKQQQRMAIMNERSDKEYQIKRKEGWMPKIVGGSWSCLRRIVRKHGPTQDEWIPCRNGTNGWNTRRRKMRRKRWRKCISEMWRR